MINTNFLTESLLHHQRHLVANGGTTGERQERDALILGHGCADICATTHEGAHGTGKIISFQDGGENLCYGDADQRRGGRPLPEDGVSADKGQGAVPSIDSAGEVKGTDDSYNTQWVPVLQEHMARS